MTDADRGEHGHPSTIIHPPFPFVISSKSTTFAAQLIFLPKTGK
jgi:hypothetical protein